MSLIQKLDQFLTCPQCLRCGSLITKNLFHCILCETSLFENFLSQQCISLSKNLKIESFFDWRPDESDSFSFMMHLLKNRNSKLAWQQFARLVTLQSSILNSLKASPDKNVVLIPVPGHNESSTHSIYFAKYLSRICGLKFENCLSMAMSQSQQKHLDLRARQNRYFQINEEFTTNLKQDLNNKYSILLVDDIVTTGNTLAACQDAIKSVNSLTQVQAVVLVRRALKYEKIELK